MLGWQPVALGSDISEDAVQRGNGNDRERVMFGGSGVHGYEAYTIGFSRPGKQDVRAGDTRFLLLFLDSDDFRVWFSL